jgi:oligopeptidase A
MKKKEKQKNEREIKLSKQIMNQLRKDGFPDLGLLYWEEALAVAPMILDSLLQQEKTEFEDFINMSNDKITFDSFDDEGLLDYYWSLLNHYQNVNNTDSMRKIIDDFRPTLQDFWNYVAYNQNLYEKTVYCYENTELNNDQKRALELRIQGFKDRGISLWEDKKDALKELNKVWAELSNNFSNNIVDDEATFEYIIEDFEVIKDLPEDVLKNTKLAAEKKEKTWYLFDADPSSYLAILKFCSDENIRAYFEKAQNSFASAGKFDNREIILNILKNKKAKSEILGYKNAAEMSLNSKMADSPEQIFELIQGISEKAKVKALSEKEVLKEYFKLEKIATYDMAFYSRKYKEEKYNLDEKELKKYFEFESVLDYLHNFVKDFLGIEMKSLNIPTYSEDIKVYEVSRNGNKIAYYFLDAFYRKEKRGWAWADNLREKSFYKWSNKLPVVINCCNFLKSDTTLLAMRDVETLFHEFGHAIHEMISASELSELSGFNVEWDFVELPSQLLENWVGDRESLEKLAKHHETGDNLPENILDTLKELETYMSGSWVLWQNTFALLDMHLYSEDIPENIEALDKKTLDIVNKYGINKRNADYKMYCAFWHIFWWGYAAGYYSYMWAEILEADVFDKIKTEGMFDPKVWNNLVDTLIGQGTRKSAGKLFKDFMWREVSNEAFMKRKWLL